MVPDEGQNRRILVYQPVFTPREGRLGKGMKRRLFFWVIGLKMLMAASLPVTKAGLIPVLDGTSAPDSTLGTYTVTSFGDDTRPAYYNYSSVTSPLGGNITFGTSLELCEVGEKWTTWSHDYKGDVYWSGEDRYFITLTMPAGTSAFYFYAQPYGSAEHTITASAYDGVSVVTEISQSVSGSSGASYFGFYGTNGSVIASIVVSTKTEDFAIGEFGISMIPAPAAIILAGIGLGTISRLRKSVHSCGKWV
jgi:hypothetical protein